MNITVFGSGYVGLVQATVLADVGHQVICVDVDEQRVAALMDGHVPIYEPGLDTLLQRNIKSGALVFTTDAVQAVEHGDVQFLAVGTPPGEDGSADLSHVLTVAETIARHRDRPVIIVNKSTVPVGTADKVTARVKSILQQRDQSFAFDVVSNPEFLKEAPPSRTACGRIASWWAPPTRPPAS